jgi:AcrR family transcriptional regulator
LGKKENHAQRRQELIEVLAAHVVQEGIQSASLRPLAAAAGTSDRMLLYYFNDKEDLLQAVLVRVAGDLLTMLNQLIPAPLPAKRLLPELITVIRRADVAPYLRLWMEVTAFSTRGQQPFRAIAGAITDGFFAWIDSRLAMRAGAGRQRLGAFLYCYVEGIVMLDAVGRDGIGTTAAREALRLLD